MDCGTHFSHLVSLPKRGVDGYYSSFWSKLDLAYEMENFSIHVKDKSLWKMVPASFVGSFGRKETIVFENNVEPSYKVFSGD